MVGGAVRHQKHKNPLTSPSPQQHSHVGVTHLLHPQRLCSGEVAIFGPMTVPPKQWEMDANARRRRVRSYLLQAAPRRWEKKTPA